MKKLISFFLLLSFAFAASAQQKSTVVNKGYITYDFNGVKPGKKLSKAEYVKIFGEPLKYSTYQTSDSVNGGPVYTVEAYEYKDCIIITDTEHGLGAFISLNPEFVAFTTDIPGGIKIGDSVEKLKEIAVHRWQKTSTRDEYTDKTGGDWYRFSLSENSDQGGSVLVKDGKIIGFDYWMTLL